ncbi:hypothetical protein U2F26_27490 [Micromonospora sp. 4G57]|uniref:Arsenate reductase n=1 Tax=Micromonospora sicca TaxID=2202420 RepID=A0ABU5JIT4_9ACTN|nr:MULTISPECIES: hypothetical protein [unclassified Micromonospora]MDZ5446428.1 hypothetical protein [Micromonospora sp. 4G57]MDZ5492344.1 hypothetical protein [Micromonospora sp. 4G53]
MHSLPRYGLRLAEFDELFATVRRAERLGDTRLRLTLAGPAELETAVRDLTERENRCCSFFTFDVTTQPPGQVVLDVAVPAVHVDVLDALAARVSQRGTP